VEFSGIIKEVLEAIAELGDPIDVPPELIMKGSLEDSHSGYKGKIFNYGEYGNALQSMPFSSSFYILLELVNALILSLYTFSKSC
jgi:hypothetical protein